LNPPPGPKHFGRYLRNQPVELEAVLILRIGPEKIRLGESRATILPLKKSKFFHGFEFESKFTICFL
jgi:hypothetical protein